MTDTSAYQDAPPRNATLLAAWLDRIANTSGIASGRLRRQLGFMILAAMLDTARHAEDGQPLFLVKGGVAMELRTQGSARATRDTALSADTADLAAHLDPALRSGFGDFTATRTQIEPVRDTGALRCEIKIAYRNKPVVTVPFEIARVEAGIAIGKGLRPIGRYISTRRTGRHGVMGLRSGGVKCVDRVDYRFGGCGAVIDPVAVWPLGNEQFEIGGERRVLQLRAEVVEGAGRSPSIWPVRAEALGNRGRCDTCVFNGEPEIEKVAPLAALEQRSDLCCGQLFGSERRHVGFPCEPRTVYGKRAGDGRLGG
jgi:hypothetical protein